MAFLLLTSLFLILLALRAYLKAKKALDAIQKEYSPVKQRYQDLSGIEKDIEQREKDIQTKKQELQGMEKEKQDMEKETADLKALSEALQQEINTLESNEITYGLYKPQFNFETSAEYDNKLDAIREQEKSLIDQGKAAFSAVTWTVEGSAKKGEQMTKQAAKLMLRAFNGECDAAVARVKWNNIGTMENRVNTAFSAINRLGAANRISIVEDYLKLKIDELHLEFERQEKLYQEKEEQKRIREQMREEEKARAEFERAQQKAEEEETKYEESLKKAREEVAHATGKQLEELQSKIADLESNLADAQARKERAISQAQLTKAGHMYVVSNIGSFGENVYKIGMTRRLEPMDRIDELGNASVPFDFDVHAIVYSENVPELEHKFHEKLSHLRLNLLNERREFFYVTLDELAKTAKEFGLSIELTKIAEAKEFRASESMRLAKQLPLAPSERFKMPDLTTLNQNVVTAV